MDILKILMSNGIEKEVAETISATIKQEIPKEFVSKKQYEKRVNQLDELNETIADLEVKANSNGESEYKAKFDTLVKDFEAYKTNIQKQEQNKVKKDLLLKSLEKENFNKASLDLLTTQFDFDKIEIEENNIKGWEELVTPIKQKYADFITVSEPVGTPPVTPPPVTTTNKGFTVDDIKSMTKEQIKQNYDTIKKGLVSK